MRTKTWLCIGTWFCLAGCGSDSDGGKTSPKDAAVEAGKKDVVPPNLDVADAPPLPNDSIPDSWGPETKTPDVPASETAPTEAATPIDGPAVRLDGSPIDGNPADTAQPPIDSGTGEAGASEAGGPLPALFTSSPCKKTTTASSTSRPGVALKVIDNQAGLEGLACVAWQRGSTDAQIDLFNFDGACGANWQGDGTVAADGSVKLTVDNPSCMVASCGICMYDWSFTLRSPIPANQSELVSVQVSSCPSSTTSTSTTSASVGPEKSGIRCSYAAYGALAWHASAKGLCGTAGMPCDGSSLCGSGSASSTGTCDTGLVCDSSAAPNEARCLTPCQKDADCPRTDVWACTSGLCRPRGF